MKVWVLLTEWVIDSGESGSNIEVFSSLESAETAFKNAVNEDKNENYKGQYDNPDSGYSWDESEHSWEIWESGYYMSNHSSISITEHEVKNELHSKNI